MERLMKLHRLLAGSIFVSALLGSAAPASAATVMYRYVGLAWAYTPPLNFPNASNPYGPNLEEFGYFDDSIVTPNFTGTLTSGFTVLTTRIGGGMTGTISFVNGQIVSWNLRDGPVQGPSGAGVTVLSVNSGSDHYDR